MKKLLSALIVAVMVFSTVLFAFADDGLINQIIEPSRNDSSGESTARDMLRQIGYDKIITMPKTGSYFDIPVAVYIDAPKDHSIYVYKNLLKDKDDYLTFAYEGQRVAALAEQEDMTCIMYADKDFKATAGWVETRYLSDWFPGTEVTVGTPCVTSAYYVINTGCNWSKNYFVDTEQRYTVMDTLENCVQFKLNYQLLDKGGAGISEVAGPRLIYVNDGSGWQEIGRFDYSGSGAVQVTVNLPEPMNLKAVATVALCEKPDTFFFRQIVFDTYVA